MLIRDTIYAMTEQIHDDNLDMRRDRMAIDDVLQFQLSVMDRSRTAPYKPDILGDHREPMRAGAQLDMANAVLRGLVAQYNEKQKNN